MQISVRVYPLLIACSVLGFRKGFLNSLFEGLFLMDCISCLKHLTLDYQFGCWFFLFGNFTQVSEFLCLFFMLGFGLKFLYSDGFFKGFIRFLSDFRVKPWELTNGFSSKSVIGGKFVLNLIDKVEEKKEIHQSNPCTDSDEKIQKPNPNFDEDSDYSEGDENDKYIEEDDESDVSRLRNLIKIERHRANEAIEELTKEREASATAAEEAMAMILRLQNEKSLIDMEFSQFKRLAEEKQIHDQEVIRSLQWLVCRHESERSLSENKRKLCRQKLKVYSPLMDESDHDDNDNDHDDNGDGDESSFNGCIWEDLENVLYSSRDANVSPE